MGGRGTFAVGNNVPYCYETVGTIDGIKVLQGTSGKHGLPESSHSSEAYIKLKPDGTFHEMRFYNKDHILYMEIAYHPEQSLTGDRHTPVLHYHLYDTRFSMNKTGAFERSNAKMLTDDMKRKYKKIFQRSQKYMIGGNPNDFLDRIYSCQDTIYIYKGIKYWFQGYMPDSNTVHMEIIQYQPANNKEIWSHDATTIEQCKQAFIDAPLFDGKTFWDVEQDMEWVDD